MSNHFYTPWGIVRDAIVIAPGVLSVKTDKSGGIVISESMAKRRLSPQAIDRSRAYGKNYFFHEDFEWAIPAYEVESWRDGLCKGHTDPLRFLHVFLSRWMADYLLAREIKPEEKAFRLWQQTHYAETLAKEKHPGLIVMAYQDGDCVTVETADGKLHHVTAESYERLELSCIFMLSACHPQNGRPTPL